MLIRILHDEHLHNLHKCEKNSFVISQFIRIAYRNVSANVGRAIMNANGDDYLL